MAKTQYGHLVKSISFSDRPGYYRQVASMNGEFLGFDVHMEYGTYVAAGRMGTEPHGPRVNDYNEVMIWMGVDDPRDMGYLGAEVELCLGEEKERHMITTSTSVAIPRGFVHFPATIARVDKRFIFMTVSCAPESKPKQVPSDRGPGELARMSDSKYGSHISHLAFTRNGPWHYGPNNQDTHDGAITFVKGKDFEFNMSYESVRKAPYRFGPNPEHVHVHPSYFEFLLFMGMDCNDLSVLGAEVETTLGKEMEKHTFSTPTVVVVPEGFPHGRTTILKLDKPFIFAVVRPLSSGTTKDRAYL